MKTTSRKDTELALTARRDQYAEVILKTSKDYQLNVITALDNT